RNGEQVDDTGAMRALIAAMPAPAWARDEAGKLTFVNQAYARAVEAKDSAEAIERGIELFEHGGRSEILRAHEAAAAYSGRLAAGGTRERPRLDRVTVAAAPRRAGVGRGATPGAAG